MKCYYWNICSLYTYNLKFISLYWICLYLIIYILSKEYLVRKFLLNESRRVLRRVLGFYAVFAPGQLIGNWRVIRACNLAFSGVHQKSIWPRAIGKYKMAAVPSDIYGHIYSFLIQNKFPKTAKAFKKETLVVSFFLRQLANCFPSRW